MVLSFSFQGNVTCAKLKIHRSSFSELPAGSSYFVVTYDQVRRVIGEIDNGFVIKVYQHADIHADSSAVIAEFPGVLTYYRAGVILGNLVQYDVNITDGELSTNRKDFNIEGVGPDLSLSRSYKSNWPEYSVYSAYGPGWSPNTLIWLDVVATGKAETAFNQPKWVLRQAGNFQSFSSLPASDGEARLIRFNNSEYFKRVDDRWIPHMGFHGRVYEDEQGFELVSKDGTRYYFAKPEREVIDDPKSWFDNIERVVKQGYETMPGVKPVEYVARIADANGNTLTYAYGPSRFGKLLLRVEDNLGRSVAFKYKQLKTNIPETMPYRVVEIEGPGGLLLKFEYDDNGMLSKFKRDDKSEDYRYVKRDYGKFSRYSLASTTNGRGYSNKFEYLPQAEVPVYISSAAPFNSFNEVVSTVYYPDGSAGRILYPEEGRNERLVYDLIGNVTKYRINRYGNPISILKPEGTLTEMEWSDGSYAVDLLLNSKHARPGSKVTYQYDSQGNVIFEQEEGSKPTVTKWSLKYSKVIERYFPGGGFYKAKLNDKGNAVYKEWSDGTKYDITYNERGQKTELKVNNGVTINYFYDRNGYMNKEIHSSNGVTDYVYDVRGRLLSKKVDNGAESIWRYDDLDRKIYEKNDDGEFHYEYDSEDNLIYEEKVGKYVIRYLYDKRDRVVKQTLDNRYSMTYSYDNNSNLLEQKDYDGVVRHFRYSAGNVRFVDPIEVKQAGLPVQSGR
jgi:YD repeat-containing protein